jgi:hypothetical protein
MVSEDHSSDKPGKPGADPTKGAETAPGWAGGLKQLYDSVVEEPLPDAFKDLLDKLDSGDKLGGPSGKAG